MFIFHNIKTKTFNNNGVSSHLIPLYYSLGTSSLTETEVPEWTNGYPLKNELRWVIGGLESWSDRKESLRHPWEEGDLSGLTAQAGVGINGVGRCAWLKVSRPVLSGCNASSHFGSLLRLICTHLTPAAPQTRQ